MRYPASEKLEIIRLVEQSHLSAKQTLDKLGIPRSTFYAWYDKYQSGGVDALKDKAPMPARIWNRIPDDVREQIVDATIVAAPKQRNTDGEKADIKAGMVPAAWEEKPAKLRQKDRDARWTVKFSKARVAEDGKTQQRDIAIPAFGYKNHASIDRRHGFIRGWTVTSASAWDGAQLRNVLNRGNTGSTVWADTAYRSKKNEARLEKHGYFSDIHHKKPKGRPMSEASAKANGRRSRIRAFVEHVFAQQKYRMGLFVRTIGIARARTKFGMANLAYNLTAMSGIRGEVRPHDAKNTEIAHCQTD